MLTASLINNNIPRLRLQDSVGKALQLILDFRVTHLAVVSDQKFLGLISEEDLLDAGNEKLPIESLSRFFIKAAVKENVHFLNAVNNSIQYDTNVVAVTKENSDFVGVISTRDLLKSLAAFSGANEIGGIIVLEMERYHFAISEISRIVESNDCHILHLNTTTNPLTGMLTVTLHLNKREIADVISSFERYDYTIVYYFGTENFTNQVSENYQHLMSYLNI